MAALFRRSKNSKVKPRGKENRSDERLKAGAPNLLLISIFIGILLFGLLMVFDASYYLEGWDRITKQLQWIGVGFVIALPFVLIDYRKLQYLAIPAFVISIILLIYALIAGVRINGATNWIILPGGFQFQPGEAAKLAVVLTLATVLTFFREKLKIKNKDDLHGARIIEFAVFFIGIGLVGALLVLSRDLGNALIIGIVALAVFFVSGTDFMHSLGTLMIVLIFAGLAAFAGILAPYRLARIQTFLDLLLNGEITDPKGAGYQISQILIGVGGSGGLHGTGFGHSRQRLGYLVEDTAYTDSIGAVILEELGFYKSVIFVVIYCFMIGIGFWVAYKAKDRFGQLLAAGLSIWLAAQFFIHMGTNVALVPLTGVTLPFISYGGSSIVISMVAMAIILNISRFVETGEKRSRR